MKRRFGQLLLAGAVVCAGMAAIDSLANGPVIGCGGVGSCDSVLESRWATVFGVPVALPATLLYLVTLELSLRSFLGSATRNFAFRLCASLIAVAAVYFVALQVFVVDGLCIYCLATHALAVGGVFLISTGRAPFPLPASEAQGGQSMSPTGPNDPAGSLTTRIGPLVAALVIVGCLAAVQASGSGPLGVSRTVHLKSESGATFPTNPLITPFTSEFGEVGVSLDGGLTPVFAATLPELSFKVDLGARPLQVVLMNDWTCFQCLELHAALHRIYRSARSESLPAVQIRLLPAFLDEMAENAHRAMLFVHFSSGNPQTYPMLAEEIAAGDLSPDAESIRQRLSVIEPELAARWESLPRILGEKVKNAFALADFQMRKNRYLLQLGGLPQLTVFDSVLSGLPSDAELAHFLREAAVRQESLLDSPLATKAPEVIKTCNCDPSKQSAGRLHDRACTLFATLVRNGDPRLMETHRVEGPKPLDPISTDRLDGPQIEFQAASVTTPTVPMGGVAQATFHFKNTGTQPLEILGVQTGCVCVASNGWKQVVLPGQSGRISFSYDTNARKTQGAGIHTRNLWVASNSVETEDPTYGHRLEMKIPVSFQVRSTHLRPGVSGSSSALANGR